MIDMWDWIVGVTVNTVNELNVTKQGFPMRLKRVYIVNILYILP